MPIVSMPNGDRVQFPDDMSKDEIKAKIRSKFPEAVDSGWQLAGDELLGAAKGVAKGVGNLAEELPTLGTPHVSELDPNAKKFLNSPNATWGESIGEFAGETAPTMIGGPEAALGKLATRGLLRVAPRGVARVAGDVAGRSAVGAAGGAAQPVKEGESRLTNALTGAATAGVLSPRIAGPLTGAAGGYGAGLGIEHLIQQFGFWPVAMSLGSLGVGSMGHFGLHGLARKVAQTTSAPGKWIASHIPAGVAGGAGAEAKETYDANQSGSAQGQ